MEISFVFPCFRRQDAVDETLRRLAECTLPFEAIAIDNSPEPLAFPPLPWLRSFRNPVNTGAAARNLGLDLAQAPVTVMLDDDSHPQAGSIEALTGFLAQAPPECAGVIGRIENLSGPGEASLLPSVFHGAGAAFRTETMRRFQLRYPESFLFYGEEYRLSLEIARAGLFLLPCPEFRLLHRRDPNQRSLDKIFYNLGRHNRATWAGIVPEEYEELCIADSLERYRLTAAKEGVPAALERGLKEAVEDLPGPRMALADFRRLMLLDRLAATPIPGQSLILCGSGKAPSLWCRELEERGISVQLADLNPGIAGKDFRGRRVLSLDQAQESAAPCLLGLASPIEENRWIDAIGSQRIIRLA
ncbi:MAG: hypothetical protein RL095_549 [Verrucomicrobiota bacterium]|jgi:GT2 family glycosyltransferase